MSLKDMMKTVKKRGEVSLKKDLDFYLQTKYYDLESVDRGHSGNLHPSGISGCARAEVYGRIEAPAKEDKISPRVQRIFNNGSSYHERTQQYYARMGILWGNWRCKSCAGNLVKESEEAVHIG